MRQAATLAWTANNRFGFDRIDFGRLSGAATIITISRAMKHLMWGYGVNPAVVPNGLPDAALTLVDAITSRVWDESFDGVTTLAKIGRWDPDKRWHMAIDAVAALPAMRSGVLRQRSCRETTSSLPEKSRFDSVEAIVSGDDAIAATKSLPQSREGRTGQASRARRRPENIHLEWAG